MPGAIFVLAAAIWLIVVARYAAQGPRQVLAHLRDAVLAPFVPLAVITPAMLGSALAVAAFSAGRALVVISLVLTVAAGGWLTGQLHLDDTTETKGQEEDMTTSTRTLAAPDTLDDPRRAVQQGHGDPLPRDLGRPSTARAVIAAKEAPTRAVPAPAGSAAGPTGAAPRAQVRAAVADSCLPALSCLVSYWLATTILAHAHSGTADDLLGGMWAAIATVFVVRHSYQQSMAAALSRMSATLVSFALCLAYLAFLPFHAWALAVLIGLSALAATLIGRPEDAITAAITTTVVMVAAELSPHDAWQQPIFRLADTAIGVAVGIAAAWTGLRLIRRPSGTE